MRQRPDQWPARVWVYRGLKGARPLLLASAFPVQGRESAEQLTWRLNANAKTNPAVPSRSMATYEEAERLRNVPSTTKAEMAVTVVSDVVGSVVPFGNLIGTLLAPFFRKNLDRWQHLVGTSLAELVERLEGFDPRTLAENEPFMNLLSQTTLLAMKTSKEEKLVALRNAVVNSLQAGAPDELEQLTFLRCVDELTTAHLHVLALFADPKAWFEKNPGLRPTAWRSMDQTELVTASGISDFRGRPDLIGPVLSDLTVRNLVIPNKGPVLGENLWHPQTTKLGDAFLRFISEGAWDSDAPTQGRDNSLSG